MTTLAPTEAEFQQQVIDLANVYGWHHMHVRRTIGRKNQWVTGTSVKGWPDLYLWHERQGRQVAAELKSDSGKPTGEQLLVLASLRAAGVEAHLWRPSDFEAIQRCLAPLVTCECGVLLTPGELCLSPSCEAESQEQQ